MPKVKPLGDHVMKKAQIIASKNWREEDQRISKMLRDLHYESGLTYEKIAYILGVNNRTLQAHIAEPQMLKLPEIRNLIALGRMYGMKMDFLEGVGDA